MKGLVEMETQAEISVINLTQNKYSKIFIGYYNGTVEARDPIELHKITNTLKFEYSVIAMVSNEKTLYVSLSNGAIITCNLKNISQDKIEVLQHEDKNNPCSYINIS